MAKGDPTSGAGGGAQNPKMDQYSVMHHLMQAIGGQQQGNQNGFGGSMAPSMGRLIGSMPMPRDNSGGQSPVFGQQLQQAMGSGQPYDQQQQTQQGMNQMQQFGNQAAGYGQQQLPRHMFSRSGIGPMMSNTGMQGSLAPQNRFRQQLNQQPATDTNPQQV